MAECIILKGGGADLDVVTAGADDVLAPKVIVGPDGDPLTGTLALDGSARDHHVLSGYTYYHVNPKDKRTGSIPSMAGQTINPTASQQTVSSSGKYMTGNVVVNAVAGLTAANIKKNAVVGGVTGTFQGYVPTATDLYLRGNNPGNVSSFGTALATFDSGQITIKISSSDSALLRFTVNMTGYSYLNIQGYASDINATYGSNWLLENDDSQDLSSRITVGTDNYTISIPVSAIQITGIFRLKGKYVKGAVYRIWLS